MLRGPNWCCYFGPISMHGRPYSGTFCLFDFPGLSAWKQTFRLKLGQNKFYHKICTICIGKMGSNIYFTFLTLGVKILENHQFCPGSGTLTVGLYDRVFSPESDGFGFVEKFQPRVKKTDQTRARKPYFRTQYLMISGLNWLIIIVFEVKNSWNLAERSIGC